MIEYRSDISVELIGQWGSDLDICKSAWVSSKENAPSDVSETKQRGLLKALMRDKHGSPFEEGYFSFHIEAPRAVRDEHVRHRVGSYSSSSLRYRQGKPVCYLPSKERPLRKAEGFKQIKPIYREYQDGEYEEYAALLKEGYEATYRVYDKIVEKGFTETEAVRWLTHDGLYVAYRARFNPRSMMHFLSLRTHNENANHISFPMWEIERVALQIEGFFAEHLPLTYGAWNALGREAP